MEISELEECLRNKDFENKHLKSKVIDCKMCQNLQVQVEELKSLNESLNLTVKELYKARVLAEATLRERDELISAQCKKIQLLKEQSEILFEKLQISDQEMKQQIILFKDDKRMFLAKNDFLKKVSSSVKKEYNDMLASNDVLKRRLEIKFKFLKHDKSLKKMFEMIEQEYESNVSKIFSTSSTIDTKNLELVKEMRDKVKHFDDEKRMNENDKVVKCDKNIMKKNQMVIEMKRLELKSERLIRKDEGCFPTLG
nr:hypothetical protein [Tanacetum cinerariifolium]